MSEIHIVCPSCNAYFHGPKELMYNSVQCGDCGHEFEVTNETVDKLASRHFPGEKAKDLDAFVKKQPKLEAQGEVNFSTVEYQEPLASIAIRPIGPKRKISIIAGLCLMVLVCLVFILGSGEGGVLENLLDEKRWVLAVFSAMVGGLLLMFGFYNSKYRSLGVTLTFIMAVVLLIMPVIYSYDESDEADSELEDELVVVESAEEYLERYKADIGYSTVQEKLEGAVNPDQVVALALLEMEPVQLEPIKDYFAKSLHTSERPRVYSNRKIDGETVTLFIYREVPHAFEEVAPAIEELGEIRKVRPDLKIVEVVVDGSGLEINDLEIVSDASHPQFFQANLAELKNLNENRQLQAIQRLANVETIMLRADIVEQLKKMLQKPSQRNGAEIVQTLRRWTAEGDGVVDIVIQKARELMEREEPVPLSYLLLCTDFPTKDTADILLYAWKSDPLTHETVLVLGGNRVEGLMVKELEGYNAQLLSSAASVLRKIGTKDSIPVLLKVYDSVSLDMQKSLKATIDEIESRE